MVTVFACMNYFFNGTAFLVRQYLEALLRAPQSEPVLATAFKPISAWRVVRRPVDLLMQRAG